MKKLALLIAVLSLMVFPVDIKAQSARDYISIVGSSTVYPFATVVAEHFGKTTKFKTPKIESTGSGGGLKLFCSGVGVQHPDISNASRRIKKTECETCAKNGVKDIIELKIGYDGIVIANDKRAPEMKITLKEIFLALAKEIPDPKGGDKMVANPYKRWDEINSSLPAEKIEVLGPPPTSGTRDAFVELAMEGGCKQFKMIKALKGTDKAKFKAICHTIREDGAFIEAGENDNLIVQKLQANPNAFGIFGFSFLDMNMDKIKGALIDGIAPDFDKIASAEYPISRSLYIYVKKAHIGTIPGIKEYISEFISEKAVGEEGYLSDRGLIPMPKEELQNSKKVVKTLQTLSCDQL